MKRTGLFIIAGLATIAIVMADGTGSNAGLRRAAGGAAVKGGAETGLIGIKLYDTAIDVIRRYGNPDEVQDVSGGTGGAVGPAGGGGGAAGGAAGGARGGGGRGGGNSGSSAQAELNLPGVVPDWSKIDLFQDVPTFAGAGGATPAGGQGNTPTAAGAGQGGAPGAAGAGGGAAAGQNTRIVYTRWVYKRGNSRYAFIMNRYGQVIQIEAIGSNDSRVVTNKGIRYGAKFADIINRYGVPDAYEINGNSLVLRYLVKNKVAFRLNRLKDDAPHVVTGVVVAAGKA